MIRWIQAFVDRPAGRFDKAVAFWTAVTGTTLSAPRGTNQEFVTLIPPQGDAYLKAQAIGGPAGYHLDLDVDDPQAGARRALELGAELVADNGDYVVVRSPGGQPFCFTEGTTGTIPSPTKGPEGATSRIDQVCLDIGPSDHATETAFWSALTGWEFRRSTLPEFSVLQRSGEMPLRLLLQRLGEDRPTSAHLDLSCSDREAVASWHRSLGARVIADHRHWTVMEDPTGGVYCLTSREPEPGPSRNGDSDVACKPV